MQTKFSLTTVIAGLIISVSAILQSADTIGAGNLLFEELIPPERAAMGGSMSVAGGQPGSFITNPATWLNNTPSVILSHRRMGTGDVTVDFITGSQRWRKLSLFWGVIQKKFDDIPDTGDALSYMGSDGPHLNYDAITSFSDRSTGFLFAFSRKFDNGYIGGVQFKTLFRSIGSNRAWGGGIDLGFSRLNPDGVSLAVTVRNALPTIIKWNTGTTEIFLPGIHMGAEKQINSLRMAVELGMDVLDREFSRYSSEYRLGMEFSFMKRVAIRAGTSSQYALSLGTGFKFLGFTIDYVYIPWIGKEFYFPVQSVSIGLDFDRLGTLLDSVNP